ncbi:hypothetical protein JCM10207_001607 [Rhodosporidiobolus poonsookiae]
MASAPPPSYSSSAPSPADTAGHDLVFELLRAGEVGLDTEVRGASAEGGQGSGYLLALLEKRPGKWSFALSLLEKGEEVGSLRKTTYDDAFEVDLSARASTPAAQAQGAKTTCKKAGLVGARWEFRTAAGEVLAWRPDKKVKKAEEYALYASKDSKTPIAHFRPMEWQEKAPGSLSITAAYAQEAPLIVLTALGIEERTRERTGSTALANPPPFNPGRHGTATATVMGKGLGYGSTF